MSQWSTFHYIFYALHFCQIWISFYISRFIRLVCSYMSLICWVMTIWYHIILNHYLLFHYIQHLGSLIENSHHLLRVEWSLIFFAILIFLFPIHLKSNKVKHVIDYFGKYQMILHMILHLIIQNMNVNGEKMNLYESYDLLLNCLLLLLKKNWFDRLS